MRGAEQARRAVASKRAASRPVKQSAEDRPVAQVCVDVGLPHLDRTFDYLVPAQADLAAQPGVRVRVRFAGVLTDGFLLHRTDQSEHAGPLSYLDRVISPEVVLRPEIVRLARTVADRYAGSLSDVLRLAVPPRHARTEAEAESAPAAETEARPAAESGSAAATAFGGWSAYPTGPAFLRALTGGVAARVVWTALPGEDWPVRLAEAVAATVAGGRGALVIVPDARDLDRLDAALAGQLGPGRHVALSAALGPAERYRRYLAAARGRVSVVIGTRAAAFAPVARLGLVAIWDDGDDLYAEPRAPYPHTREVLLTRAVQGGCAALLGGFGRTAEAAHLIDQGWARELVAARDTVRERAPRVVAAGEAATAPARLPTLAWRAARDALAAGAPVLVQVPRRGYLPAVACAACRTPARCPACRGPLALASTSGGATCGWCARVAAGYACPACGGRTLRAAVIGAGRTAEELGRAFPGVAVRTSDGAEVLARVEDGAVLVVCTPGAEPVPAPPGYGAVLLLDPWALLSRADLRATEEAARRWLAAASLARPAGLGGRVVVMAEGGLAAVQALIRFDPATLATRELASRRELSFPPAVRMAALSGTASAIDDLLAQAHLPDGVEQLGPVPLPGGQVRLLLRVSRTAGLALAGALRAASGVRSARKSADPVRIQIDPLELL